MAAEQGGGAVSDGMHPPLPWYVSGNIGAEEREEIRVHVDGCAECQAEVVALAAMRTTLRDHEEAQAFHVAAEELVAFEDDDPAVTPERRAAIRQHLKRCPACTEDLTALERLRGPAADPVEVRPQVEPGVSRAVDRSGRWWWIAAAVAVLAFVSLWQLGAPRMTKATILPSHRGIASSNGLIGEGPWSLTVVLPLSAPEGRYRVQVRRADGTPVLATESNATGPPDRQVVIALRSLPAHGEYILTLEPPVESPGAPYEYVFHWAAETSSASEVPEP